MTEIVMGKRTKGILVDELSRYLFCAGLFLKQFYLLPSGSFQLGDAVLMLSVGLILVSSGLDARFKRDDIFIIFFVILETIINAVWMLLDDNLSYFRTTLYYIYNLLIVLCARNHVDNEEFIVAIIKTFRIAIALQTAVYFIGIGRWYAGVRYKGTFNDPNQFAFYVMSAFLTIKILIRKGYGKINPLDDLLTGFLVIESSSTGMLLGVCMYYFCAFMLSQKKSVIKILAIISLAIAIIIISPKYQAGKDILPEDTGFEQADFVFLRINEKIRKFEKSDTSIGGILADRNMERVKDRPEYFIFGSGESIAGQASERGEIHSTPVALAYYYGIIPFTLLVIWIRRNYREGSGVVESPAYLALLFESLLLAHQRQPVLWLLIVISSVGKKSDVQF